MMRSTAMAAGLTRSWIRCYTLGLSGQTRTFRQDEIESDLWEHERDEAGGVSSPAVFGLAVMSRLVRGMPADVFWRFKMEGPKMEINIPFERMAGGLLLALVAMMLVAGGISGYDTRPDGFDGELRRLAALSSASDNANAALRTFTGLALLGAAAGFYVALKERAPVLSTIAAFGLVASGILTLIAAALQVVLVDLAEEYVSSGGAHQDQVLVTARTTAQLVQGTVGFALLALLASAYSLAVLAERSRLVPRPLIALPAMSIVVFVAGGIARAADASNGSWIVLMSGVGLMVLWLLIAGVWLMFNPAPQSAPSGVRASATSG